MQAGKVLGSQPGGGRTETDMCCTPDSPPLAIDCHNCRGRRAAHLGGIIASLLQLRSQGGRMLCLELLVLGRR